MLLGKPKDQFEVYNDLDDELVNLFRCVRDRPAEFLLELGLLPLNSRTEFGEWLKFHTGRRDPALFLPMQDVILDNLLPMQEWAEQMKKALHDRADYKEVLQAAAFFKRMRNSYASSGRSFACQPFSVRTTFRQLEETSDRLSNVIVENQSFETLIPHYDREDAFFYLDPPYFKSEYVYEAEFGWQQHVLLRDTLANCKGKWLVSQSDFPEVRELFKDYYILEFKRIHSMAQRTHPGSQFGELLIGNYDLLEREREQPEQMSMTEMLDQPIDNEQILASIGTVLYYWTRNNAECSSRCAMVMWYGDNDLNQSRHTSLTQIICLRSSRNYLQFVCVHAESFRHSSLSP